MTEAEKKAFEVGVGWGLSSIGVCKKWAFPLSYERFERIMQDAIAKAPDVAEDVINLTACDE